MLILTTPRTATIDSTVIGKPTFRDTVAYRSAVCSVM